MEPNQSTETQKRSDELEMPQIIVILSVLPNGVKQYKLGKMLNYLIFQHCPTVTSSVIDASICRKNAEKIYREKNGIEGKIEFKSTAEMKQFSILKKQAEQNEIKKHFNQIIENYQKAEDPKHRADFHVMLFTKSYPLRHYKKSLQMIEEAFGCSNFSPVVLIQSLPDFGYTQTVFNDNDTSMPKSAPYRYETRIQEYKFPFTLHSLVACLWSSLARKRSDGREELEVPLATRIRLFKQVLYSFTCDRDKETGLYNYQASELEKLGFEYVLQFDFLQLEGLEVKGYGRIKKILDRLMKTNHKKFPESFEKGTKIALEVMKDCVKLNGTNFQDYRPNDGNQEDLTDEIYFDWEREGGLEMIDKCILRPLVNKFGFKDLRDRTAGSSQ
jgi:hypothetical protein